MTTGLLERLKRGDILLADGALGTQLQERGMPTGHCPEEYNLSHPEVVQAIYRDYYSAGSDFVSTNSFGGNRPRLERHGLADQVASFSRRAAELARSVCPAGRWVAGSIGPTGELMEPFGDFSAEEAFDVYAEQVRALAEGGVDFVIVETMMAIEEAEIAVKAAKETTGLPVSAAMTFESHGAEPRTSWGVTVPQEVEVLSKAGADIVGSNCGQGFKEMVSIVQQMRKLTDLPILAQANAGLPEWVDGRAVYRESPDSIAPLVEELLRAGANIVGGCCGTSPAHIARIRAILDRR
jgi:5-methyltetrahydrofolate--homocysteine methyltransferase